MLIRHWMAKHVISVDPNDSLLKCRALYQTHGISRLPVVDRENRVVGILSHNDIEKFKPASETGYEYIETMDILDKTRVKECMTKDPICAHVNDTIEMAAEKMLERRVSCLPVLDDDARLAGIVSERDIFKSLVSITGIHQPGVQLAFELPNQRGELRQLISLVVAHDMRLVSVLSILKDNVRIVSIRCRGASEQAEDAMIEDMKAQGLLYWVRGGKTHLV